MYSISFINSDVVIVRPCSCEAALIKYYDAIMPKTATDIVFYRHGVEFHPGWAD